jgi:hypothetical protein
MFLALTGFKLHSKVHEILLPDTFNETNNVPNSVQTGKGHFPIKLLRSFIAFSLASLVCHVYTLGVRAILSDLNKWTPIRRLIE